MLHFRIAHRLCAAFGLGLAAIVVAPLTHDAGARDGLASRANCTPAAPLTVILDTRPGPAGLLELDYTVTPLLDAAWVRVELESIHGGRVVQHQPPESGPLERDASRRGRAAVELPAGVLEGRRATELRVTATMGLLLPDGTIETVGTEAARIVGEGELPVGARAVTGGGIRTWDVTARHEGGAR